MLSDRAIEITSIRKIALIKEHRCYGGDFNLRLDESSIEVGVDRLHAALIAAALVGVLISLLQALTQVQEQTLPFAFKLMAVALTIYAMIGIFGGDFYLYTHI